MFQFNTLAELFNHIQENIKMPSYLNYRNSGEWTAISSETFTQTVVQLSSAFSKIGVVKGTTVGIIAPSSPFWLMVDFALQRIGAVSVPIFINIAEENLAYEIEDAAVKYLFVANTSDSYPLRKIIKQMQYTVVKEALFDLENENIIQWEAFLELGRETVAVDVAIGPDDLATIIYTSGSTGTPKGVELTHANLVIQIKDAQQAIALHDDVALSLLPLAHVFERMVMLYYLASGTRVYFVDNIQKVGDYLKDVRPSVMIVVPRLLEKIYSKIHVNVEKAPFFKRMIAGIAFWWARLRNPDRLERGLVDRLFDRLVYSRLLDSLGGNLRIMISGGAPLSKPISKFFLNIGLPLYQGYGLTEASPVVSVNRIGANRWGSSGQPFAHVKVKLGEHNELLVRGANVMRCYHQKPLESAQTIDSEGWLHTGDLARIDAEGYITIESRLKELYKTSTGKFVSAIKIETALVHSKWIEYAMVIADGRPFVTALIFVDSSMSESLDAAKTEQIIAQRVKAVNKHVNAWERVRRYRVIFEQPTVESGLITPSMKIIRQKVMQRYEADIESLYDKSNRGGKQ